jgi:hypothetical protein
MTPSGGLAASISCIASRMVITSRSLLDAIATWHAEIARAREHCADRALSGTGRFMEQDVNLRWSYVHMIEEYARHNGHADLVRERIDGITGV